MSSPEISVIIPTLNEESHLEKLIDQIRDQIDCDLEIIVSDGGSSDRTLEIARSKADKAIQATKGRGTQLNAGANIAQGEYFLFLHADSKIETCTFLTHALGYLKSKQPEFKKPVAGHFKLKFERTQNQNERAYRYAEEKTAFNRPYTINGDQGLLIHKKFLKALGGYDESLPFMEDQSIAEKIRLQGQWVTLPGQIITSARRFETEGFHRRYILMSIMMGLYWTGARSFFDRAPQVYKEQSHALHLKLTPFFRVIWQMLREDMGFKGSIIAWYRVGRYVRQNSWQMFYFFDIWLRPIIGPHKYPFLKFHDRIFWPITNNKICDGINTLFSFFWFMGVLGTYFWITEKFQTQN